MHVVVPVFEFSLCIFETGSPVSQAGLQLPAAQDDLVTLLLCLLSAVTVGAHHHARFKKGFAINYAE